MLVGHFMIVAKLPGSSGTRCGAEITSPLLPFSVIMSPCLTAVPAEFAMFFIDQNLFAATTQHFPSRVRPLPRVVTTACARMPAPQAPANVIGQGSGRTRKPYPLLTTSGGLLSGRRHPTPMHTGRPGQPLAMACT